MGLFSYKESEFNMLKNVYTEANKLFGIECTYYPPLSVDKDTANDPFIVLGDGSEVSVIFDSHPKTVLKSLNWYSQDKDILPLVAYISDISNSGETLNIAQYGKIKIPYVMKEHGTQLFQIDKVQGDTLNPLIWTCSLVPCTEQLDYNPDTPEIEEGLDSSTSELGFTHIKWS